MADLPQIEAYRPSAVLQVLRDKLGIRIAERTLRKKARELGACREIGNAMFFTPKDIEKLIEGLVPCRSGSSEGRGARTGRSPERSQEKEYEEAQSRLTNKSPSKKPRNSNARSGNVVTMDLKPQPLTQKQ